MRRQTVRLPANGRPRGHYYLHDLNARLVDWRAEGDGRRDAIHAPGPCRWSLLANTRIACQVRADQRTLTALRPAAAGPHRSATVQAADAPPDQILCPGVERPILALTGSSRCSPPWRAARCGLYPRQNLEQRLAMSGETELSTACLNNLLRGDPTTRACACCSRNQIASDTASARTTLQPPWTQPTRIAQGSAVDFNGTCSTPSTGMSRTGPDRRRCSMGCGGTASAGAEVAQNGRMEAGSLGQSVRRAGDRPGTPVARKPAGPREAALYYEREAREALARGELRGLRAALPVRARLAPPTQPRPRRTTARPFAHLLRSGNQTAAALELAERELGPWPTTRRPCSCSRSWHAPRMLVYWPSTTLRRLLRMSSGRPPNGPAPSRDFAAARRLAPAACRWRGRCSTMAPTCSCIRPCASRSLVADQGLARPSPALPFDDKTTWATRLTWKTASSRTPGPSPTPHGARTRRHAMARAPGTGV